MLHVHGVGDVGGIHHADGVEGVVGIGVDGRRGAVAGAEHVVVHLTVDAVKLAGLVPVVAELAVGVAKQEGLHVGGGAELVVHGGHFLIGGCDVVGRRSDLEHYVLDVAVGLLLVEVLVVLVVLLYLALAHHDGAVVLERIVYGDVVHVGSGVVLGQLVGLLKGVQVCGRGEEGAVLGIVLLGADGGLDVVPEGLQTAGLVAGNLVLHEVHEHLRVVSVGTAEHLGDHGRRIAAGGEVHKLCAADGDACILCVLHEEELVDEALPGGVADLLLLLLTVSAAAGGDLVYGGETFDLFLVVGVAHCAAGYLADVIFAGHALHCALESTRVDDKG